MNYRTYKRIGDRSFKIFGLLVTLSGLLVLGIFIFQIVNKKIDYISCSESR